MTRASFRQADIERVLRAAKATGSIVQMDARTLVMTIYPGAAETPPPDTKSPSRWHIDRFAPDGEENWED